MSSSIPSEKSPIVDSNVDKHSDTLTVSTFNLFNYLEPPNAYYDFDRIYSQPQWDKKENWIKDFLADRQPDIIGFQEVFSVDALESLVKSQGYPYYAAVDTPTVIDDFIYRDPVVALASKFPITEIGAVTVNKSLALKLGLSESFRVSRQIVRATVDAPHIGPIDCYVVHFKSKRASFEHQESEYLSTQENTVATLQAEVAGRWASSIQRGSEAALLINEIIERRNSHDNAVLMMGDFNNELGDGLLKHLTFDDSIPRYLDLAQVSRFQLRDSWQLYTKNLDRKLPIESSEAITEENINATTEGVNVGVNEKITECAINSADSDIRNKENTPNRTPTHYWNGKGSVLDYLLCSFEFDACHQSSIYEAQSYHVTDKQLINPKYDIDDLSTDHGVVSVTFTLRT